jgi:multiple sugar transport system permease protein
MSFNTKISLKLLYLLFFIAFMAAMVLPFLYLLFSSFMTERDIMAIPAKFIPSVWTLDNYIAAFTQQPLLKYLLNSFIMSILTVFFCMVAGSMAAYSIARTEIKGKKVFLLILVIISLLPPVTIINPVFTLLSSIGLLNSYVGLALVITVLEMPLAVWFLSAYFEHIPVSLEESAEIDGATTWQVLTKIIIPLVKPGLFTIGILVFINAWNQYLFAQIFNQYESYRMVTVGLTLYQTSDSIPWGALSAASVMTIIPLILIVLVLQKRIIDGMFEGGTKE